MYWRRIIHYAHFLKTLGDVNIRLLYGMWRLTKLPQPAITIFGGSRLGPESLYTQTAEKMAKMLATEGYSIITGGGPGIMEAANRGAFEYAQACQLEGRFNCRPLVSEGIGLIRLNREKPNPYVQEHIVMTHFFSRKWLLVRYSVGFIVFPGGFGTLDELCEVVTLIQCNRMRSVPVILMHSAFWNPLIEWFTEYNIKQGLISPADLKIITVLDDVNEALDLIRSCCKHPKH